MFGARGEIRSNRAGAHAAFRADDADHFALFEFSRFLGFLIAGDPRSGLRRPRALED